MVSYKTLFFMEHDRNLNKKQSNCVSNMSNSV